MPNKKTPAPKTNKKATSAEPYVIQNRTLTFDFSADETPPEPAAARPAAKAPAPTKMKGVTAAPLGPAVPGVGVSKTARGADATGKSASSPVQATPPASGPKPKKTPVAGAGTVAGTGAAKAAPKAPKKVSAGKAGAERKIRQVTPASQRLLTAAPPTPVAGADAAPKVRRSRVPSDLSQQYGEKISSRLTKPAPAVEVETKARRKRTTASEREDRKRQLAPDEGLLARLSKINALSLAPAKKEPRASGWKFQCGRCGTVTRFETPGGLCPGCGAIALKDR